MTHRKPERPAWRDDLDDFKGLLVMLGAMLAMAGFCRVFAWLIGVGR